MAGQGQGIRGLAVDDSGSRNGGNPQGLNRLPGPGLVSHETDDGGGRTDEADPAVVADLREMGILGEVAVTGMDGVDVGDLGRADDAGDVQVALEAAGGADADGLVREADMEQVAIGLGVDGHRAEAQFLAGGDDS